MKNNSKADAFIVTKDDGSWDLIGANVLDKYTTKNNTARDGSKQIETLGWDYNSFHEPLYEPEQLLDLLEINTYHAKCVEDVALTSAGLGYTIGEVSEETSIDPVEKKKAENFLSGIKKLNKQLYQRQYDRGSMGYGAIEVIRTGRSNSPITNLKQIPGQHLRRHRDGIRVKQQIGNKTVWFVIYGENYDRHGRPFDVDAETGEICRYNSLAGPNRANEILWSQDYTSKTQFYGMPRIAPAIPTIEGDLSRTQYNTSFFRNYGLPAFAVLISGDFEDYDKEPGDEGYDFTKTLKYKISQQVKEVMKNPHSAMTILMPSEGEEGNVEIKLQPLSVETKEASFRLYRRDNRDEVLTAHRVPAYRIGINETGNLGGSNSKDANRIYKDSVIEPLQLDDENDINMLLRDELGIKTCKFQIIEIDIHDYTNDWKVAREMIDKAVMRPLDAQIYFGERFGIKPDTKNPYLQEYYMNGKPLDQLWENSEYDPPGTSQVLGELEQDLLTELDNDGGGGEDAAAKNLSGESEAIKNAFKQLTKRLQSPFSR